MKFRIVKRGNKFYAERKGWLGWVDCVRYTVGGEPTDFDTAQQAEEQVKAIWGQEARFEIIVREFCL